MQIVARAQKVQVLLFGTFWNFLKDIFRLQFVCEVLREDS